MHHKSIYINQPVKQHLFFFRERMKKLLAIETARAAVVTQWTKKVIVEKLHHNSESVTEPLVSIKVNKYNIKVFTFSLKLEKF